MFTGGAGTRQPKPKSKNLPKLIVVVCPPFALSMGAVKQLSTTFAVNEAESIRDFKLPTNSDKQQLLLVQSMDGIVDALTKLFDIDLYVHRSNRPVVERLVKNFYADEVQHYSFLPKLSRT